MRQESEIIDIDGIGPVEFRRSPKAKNIRLSIKPFKGLVVSVPKGLSFQKAGQFVVEKRSWIQKNLSKVKATEQEQLEVKKQLQELDWDGAEADLIHRTIQLANQHGFEPNRITVRNQKTKWGSCSSQNNISLNIHLALLPTELRDYVILHELVHTRIKNHSPAFWQALDKYVENAKAVDAQLNAYRLSARH